MNLIGRAILKIGKLRLLCITIVVVFALFGYCIFYTDGGAKYGSEGAVGLGGLGFGLAVCIHFGTRIVGLVRKNQLRRGRAFLLLAASLVGCPVLTLIAMVGAAGAVAPDMFQGESGLWLYTSPVVVFGFGIFAFIPFSAKVLHLDNSRAAD